MEAAIDLDDIGVIKEALDLEFTYELNKEVVLNDAFLLNHLQA